MRETIAVDGAALGADEFDSVVGEVERAAGGAALTSFELLTAAALLRFSRSVDVAVVEVGVGGLRDATNVIERPAVSVITSVALDHSDLLGDTLPAIAREKAGIVKRGCPAVIGPLDPSPTAEIAAWAERVAASEVRWVTPATPHPAKRGWAQHAQLDFPLVLPGEFQLSNSAVALEALRVLQNQPSIGCSERAIVEGMRAVRWPGRLEWSDWPTPPSDGRREEPEPEPQPRGRLPVLLDGAHNPAAASALRAYVDGELGCGARHGGAPLVWVIAISQGKDVAGLLRLLLREGDSAIFVPFEVGLPPKVNTVRQPQSHRCCCCCLLAAARGHAVGTGQPRARAARGGPVLGQRAAPGVHRCGPGIGARRGARRSRGTRRRSDGGLRLSVPRRSVLQHAEYLR